MRLGYGFVAGLAWVVAITYMTETGINISQNARILSLAIIVAGAMAGGD